MLQQDGAGKMREMEEKVSNLLPNVYNYNDVLKSQIS